MTRTTPGYIELTLDDDTDDETSVDPVIDVNPWFDEKTVQLDFDTPALSADTKLVVGYLTMEEHGMFANLSVEEQEQVATTLRR